MYREMLLNKVKMVQSNYPENAVEIIEYFIPIIYNLMIDVAIVFFADAFTSNYVHRFKISKFKLFSTYVDQ